MLNLWLSPIPKSTILDHASAFQFQEKIQVHTKGDFPNLTEVTVAIVGLGEDANLIRRDLYSLIWHFGDLKVADIGNIRNSSSDSIIQLLSELIDSDIVPILIGGDTKHITPHFVAHKDTKRYTNIAIVDEQIPYLNNNHNYLDHILSQYPKSIFNLGLIGSQRFLCTPEQLEWIEQRRYDSIRLGAIKSDIEDTEPVIRDADILFFRLNALNGATCPGVQQPSPNGLGANEACQLTRYAGMSDKLRSISILGFQAENDNHHITTQVIAQMIWYFLDGFYNRKQDFPVSTENMTEYIVDFKRFDYQITFWKSNKSGRWWMQIPVKTNDSSDLARHRLIPCSYKDYQEACAGKLPERLFTALSRF